MNMFYVLLFFVLCQRIFELYIARNNERWMKERGGIELGRSHYKWFIVLHSLFFIGLILEYQLKVVNEWFVTVQPIFLFIFLLAQIGRIWCIYSLGRFWNTKIIVLPKVSLIRKGPYRWFKHPNYIIVFIELISLPLSFNLYFTAFIFPFLHLLLLTIRVPLEEEALHYSSSK